MVITFKETKEKRHVRFATFFSLFFSLAANEREVKCEMEKEKESKSRKHLTRPGDAHAGTTAQLHIGRTRSHSYGCESLKATLQNLFDHSCQREGTTIRSTEVIEDNITVKNNSLRTTGTNVVSKTQRQTTTLR